MPNSLRLAPLWLCVVLPAGCTVVTDHKQRCTIACEDSGIPPSADRFVWSRSLGAISALAGDVDGQGQIYFVGRGTHLDASGKNGPDSPFVTKLAADGGLALVRRPALGQGGLDSVNATAPGRLVVSGSFAGRADLGGNPPVVLTSPDAGAAADLLASLDPESGEGLWAKQWTLTRAGHWPAVVAVDREDHSIILCGRFDVPVSLGGSVLVPQGAIDLFCAKFSEQGTHLWSRSVARGDSASFVAVAIDASHEAVLLGAFDGALLLDGHSYPPPAGRGMFFSKLDPNGNFLWMRTATGLSLLPYALAVDPGGSVFLGGSVSGTVDLGGGALPGGSTEGGWIARFDGAGSPLWSTRVGGSGFHTVEAIDLDAAGDLLVGGAFGDSFTFDETTHYAAAENSIFIARLAATGGLLWSAAARSGSSHFLLGLLASPADDSAVVVGFSAGGLDFEGGTVASPSRPSEIFVLKLREQ
jgi:hypothetical protein